MIIDNQTVHCIMSWLKSYCELCKSISNTGIQICEHCQHHLPLNKLACKYCAYPLHTEHPLMLCGDCLKQANKIDTCIIPFLYQQPIKRFITQLKFNRKLHYANLLSQLFLEKIAHPEHIDYIIPVPLHPKRLRQRGFNQALELAKPISKTLGIPIIMYSCKRIINTPPQSELPLHKREKNICGAFAAPPNIENKKIILFDDVYTTGNTLNELSITLKKQGATHISGWCIARACRNDGN